MSNTAAYESLVVYSITTESVDFQPTFFHKLVRVYGLALHAFPRPSMVPMLLDSAHFFIFLNALLDSQARQ